jgi:hypothetical protein
LGDQRVSCIANSGPNPQNRKLLSSSSSHLTVSSAPEVSMWANLFEALVSRVVRPADFAGVSGGQWEEDAQLSAERPSRRDKQQPKTKEAQANLAWASSFQCVCRLSCAPP